MTKKKTENEADNKPISLRLEPFEKEELQQQAKELNINMTSMLRIRIGSTGGIVQLLKTIDERLRRFEDAAEAMSRTTLMIEDVRVAIEENRAKELTWEALNARLIEAEEWRREAIELSKRIEQVSKELGQPTLRMVEAVEMLSGTITARNAAHGR